MNDNSKHKKGLKADYKGAIAKEVAEEALWYRPDQKSPASTPAPTTGSKTRQP